MRKEQIAQSAGERTKPCFLDKFSSWPDVSDIFGESTSELIRKTAAQNLSRRNTARFSQGETSYYYFESLWVAPCARLSC